jgi:signal transduction histidine kinase
MAERVTENQKKELSLEEYRRYVRDKLKTISSIFESIAAGDFSVKIEVPQEEDEFTELLVGLKILIEDVQELIKLREEAVATVAAAQRARVEEAERAREALEARMKELEDSRKAIIHILEDVNQAYKKLGSAYRELKVLSRMRDEFLSMTSHELKTPLTPIRSFLQLMESGKLGKFTKKQKEGLAVISAETERLKDSIDKLLRISRLELGKIELKTKNLRLSTLIQNTVERMEPAAKQKRITLIQKIAKLPVIRADEEQLAEVLNNLVDNAIKFTHEGGRVTVEAKRERDKVLVTVTDTGIGIAEEHMPMLFKKFFKVDYSVPGAGLGLSICKKIIRAHGGRMWAKSELGKGSTFFFTLPVKK